MSEIDLHLGNCLNILPTLAADSVDLVVTSPPYNVGVKYADDEWEKDHQSNEKYKIFADKVMTVLYRITKKGGRVCVEIGGSGRNKPLSWIWQNAAYVAGFGLFSEIGIQHRKTNQTAWGSWLKSDNVFTIPNFHMMYVFYKESGTKRGDRTTIDKSEFVEWTRGYWKINYSNGNREHPATFPMALPKRCLKLFGHDNDLVLDPMMGTGTTGLACIDLDRDFVGIEIKPQYFEIAEKCIKEAQMQLRLPFDWRGNDRDQSGLFDKDGD